MKNVRNSVEEGELTRSFSRLRTVLVKCTTITQDSMGEKVGNKLKTQLLSQVQWIQNGVFCKYLLCSGKVKSDGGPCESDWIRNGAFAWPGQILKLTLNDMCLNQQVDFTTNCLVREPRVAFTRPPPAALSASLSPSRSSSSDELHNIYQAELWS